MNRAHVIQYLILMVHGACVRSWYKATVNAFLCTVSGLFVGQYLQRIIPALDIGAECMYQRGGHVPGGQIAVMSLAARINGKI